MQRVLSHGLVWIMSAPLRAQRLFYMYFGSRGGAGFASSFEAVEKPPASIRTERAKASTSKTAATYAISSNHLGFLSSY